MRCPLCGSGPVRPLYGRLRGGLGLDRCLACGLRCVRPFPTAAEAAAVYTPEYFRSDRAGVVGYGDYSAFRPALEATFRRNFAVLRRFAPAGRLLDIGCAEGYSLLVAREAGFDVEGVEISAAAAARAREVSRVPVHAGTLADLPTPGRPFDVVTLWDVLEHTIDPGVVLGRACRLLRPGGALALTVPDPEGFAGRMLGPRWFGYEKVREHPVYFPRRTLRAAIERAGFRLVYHRPHPWTAPAGWLLARARSYVGAAGPVAAGVAGAIGLGDALVPFPFINQLAVAVRPA